MGPHEQEQEAVVVNLPVEVVELVSVEHVRIWTETSFENVLKRIDAACGIFDAARVVELATAGAEPGAILEAIERMAGSSGFMRFATLDHGAVPRLQGHPMEAVRYLIGNPLIAARMTTREVGSSLYAPLSMLVVADGGGTRIEYDRPSSLFGRFQDHDVAEIAADLDAKLAALIESVTGQRLRKASSDQGRLQ